MSCSGLNYGGVATVVLRYACMHMWDTEVAKIKPAVTGYSSVFILAFVKSEGKAKPEGRPSERSPLLGDKSRSASLDGSLMQKVVSW